MKISATKKISSTSNDSDKLNRSSVKSNRVTKLAEKNPYLKNLKSDEELDTALQHIIIEQIY